MLVIKALGLVYTSLVTFLYFFQEKLIFFPQPPSYELRSQLAKNEVIFQHEGISLHGWYRGGEKEGNQDLLIIYFGGNAEEVSYSFFELSQKFSHAVLAVNYRGFGSSEGKPSEAAILQDANFIVKDIMRRKGFAPEKIILLGRSLGAAVATFVASNYAVRGSILVTPFDSLTHLAQGKYPMFPVSLLLKHRFPAKEWAQKIKSPCLLITGGQDKVVPNSYSINLAEKWQGGAEHYVIEAASHNNISNFPDYWKEIENYLAKISVD